MALRRSNVLIHWRADMDKQNRSVRRMRYVELVSLGLALLLAPVAAVPAFAQDLKTVSSSLSSRIAASGRRTVAVIDFTDLQGNVTELGRFLAEELSVDLVGDAKGFEVIERTQLKTILQEHKLATTGLIDPQTARKLGQIAGVDALVTGIITPLGDSVRLSAKVLDTTTAKMIAASTVDIPKTRAVEELLARGIGGSEQPPNPLQPPDQGHQPTTKLEENGLLFEVTGCLRSGRSVDCTMAITNKAARSRVVCFDSRQSYFVDNRGNTYREYVAPDARLPVCGAPWSGQFRAEIEPELPIKGVVSAKDVDPAATMLTYLMVYYIERETSSTKLAFRNMPIRQK
jgi:TolB-like protein